MGRKRRKSYPNRPQRLYAQHEGSHSIFESFTGKEVKAAMEKIWAKPGASNPVKKAKWKP